MQKNIFKTLILSAIAISFAQTNMAFADSMPYEPVFETLPINETITTTPVVVEQPVQAPSTKITPINNIEEVQDANINTMTSAEATSLQNAMLQLDGAQVENRNQLTQYKSEYQKLDEQYKLLKEQRSLKAKQIRATERKIRNIETTKERIRKNLN
jgi:hypothetical protein